jgi:signal transduction histidine kinase
MGGRVQAAQANAVRRQHREGRQLTPLRWWVVAVVVAVAATSHPAVGLSGRRLGLTVCLVIFVVEMLGFPLARIGSTWARVAELTVMGGSAVAVGVLQPNGVSELAASASVFTVGVALEPAFAAALGGSVALALAVALSVTGRAGAVAIAAEALLCAVLGVTGGLLRRYRLSQDRTELLLAELQEARDDQARAAASQERESIARELHDVLAHSLSGLSIQLEMARKLASTLDAPVELRAAIDGAADLSRAGVLEARKAVGALRRDDRLGPEQLPELVGQFRRDFHLDVNLQVDGAPRPVSPDIGLTLYRVTGEALTNVARHAAGAVTEVTLSFATDAVRVEVTNTGGSPSELSTQGTGWGLAGVRERVKLLGGELTAGPTKDGWSVLASVPA